MEAIEKLTKGITTYLDKNPTHVLVICLLLTVYSTLAAPRLPNSLLYFFDSFVGKLVLLFTIAFVASHNIQIALTVALGFLLVLHVVNYKKTEAFLNYARDGGLEKFNDYGDMSLDMSPESVDNFANEAPSKSDVKDKKVLDVAKEYNAMVYATHDHSLDVHCQMPSEKDSAICKWYMGLKDATPAPTAAPTTETPPTPAGQGTSTNATTTTTEFFTNCSAPQVAGPVDDEEYAPAVF
jgi:hypothetical protein